ncbi:unnamed protein product [Peronospora belbahrii]|uniref:Aminotransferase class I/classII domain-containing protein n=1 Tax=Peronospora belbahrii TaxID=622444 RepID=A0AAU9KZE9_9STRA|nr:unnamed protein product [Peronospora belbahrii]CAH0517522.1 unnamed protein product [Peronospora belbahrii]
MVWVMTSWTKIWSCTVLRICSVVGLTPEDGAEIKRKQAPCDDAYLQKTWDVTPKWRVHAIELLTKRCPNLDFLDKPFLSWIWLNTKSADISENACKLAKEHGVPVLSDKPSFNLPTFVRIAARSPDQTAVLLKA